MPAAHALRRQLVQSEAGNAWRRPASNGSPSLQPKHSVPRRKRARHPEVQLPSTSRSTPTAMATAWPRQCRPRRSVPKPPKLPIHRGRRATGAEPQQRPVLLPRPTCGRTAMPLPAKSGGCELPPRRAAQSVRKRAPSKRKPCPRGGLHFGNRGTRKDDPPQGEGGIPHWCRTPCNPLRRAPLSARSRGRNAGNLHSGCP
mmetsp:Transcript_26257/g.66114  ORF Transcript_26257/g.66114 Transcript_26257/m.66114 type:complete len:200 (+) Transcript_26257:1086-1685(+)